MLKALMTATFDNYIKGTFKEQRDIRTFLLNHERKNLCINNMVREVQKVELKMTLKKDTLTNLAIDISRMFCKSALEAKRQELMSVSSKIAATKQFEANQEEANLDANNRLDLSDLD